MNFHHHGCYELSNIYRTSNAKYIRKIFYLKIQIDIVNLYQGIILFFISANKLKGACEVAMPKLDQYIYIY